MRPCSYIMSMAAAKRPEMEAEAPMTGASDDGWNSSMTKAPAIPQMKK